MNNEPEIGKCLQQEQAGPFREKYWRELSIEQKIERTNEIVRSLSTQPENLRSRLDRTEAVANSHSHGSFGQVLVTASHNQGEAEYRNPVLRRETKENHEDRYF